MALPQGFFAEPRFRGSSAALAQLAAATELTPETPGIAFAYAAAYYQVEMFATEGDRDCACGPSGNDDVRYFAATRQALSRTGVSLDDISCGHTVDHPRFEEVLSPIFNARMRRLIGDLMRSTAKAGVVADTTISIARRQYTFMVRRVGDWLNFEVGARSLFERPQKDLMDRTVKYLEGRLILQNSAALSNVRCN